MQLFNKNISGFVLGLTQLALSLTIGILPVSAHDASPAAQFAALPQLAITATDYAFDAPNQLAAGRTAVTLRNNGQQPHHAALLKLNDRVTFDDVAAAMKQGPEAALSLVTTAGGPGTVLPGAQSRVVLDLAAGQYLIVCFLPGPDGMSHAQMGMVRPLIVKPGDANSPRIDAVTTVTLDDFNFDMPMSAAAGEQVWRIENAGAQPHEISIFKLTEAIPMEQLPVVLAEVANPSVATPAAGPPPVLPVGGLEPISPGGTAWLDLDLQPGNYVAVCFVPDPATGERHLQLGMIMPFSVAS